MNAHVAPAALVAVLALPSQTFAQLSRTGNVTLFSDTACEEPVYVNSFILGRDTCGKENAEASYPDAFRSFIVNERPWCDNGSRPWFNVYSDPTCNDLSMAYPPGALYHPTGPDADGTCVAPGDYKGMAFLCDGIEGVPNGGWGDGQPTGADEVSSTTTIASSSATSTTVPATTDAGNGAGSSTASTPAVESTASHSHSSTVISTSGATSTTTSRSTSAAVSTPTDVVPTGNAVRKGAPTGLILPIAALLFITLFAI
ncbi:hypothetical protein F4780DRAFT_325630 [Xylariomycetidae sp. FL0641]|nr:hypothetical protein F4780DRAFT_325630 [Xylariomycetidae sp. FL0641]